MKKAIACLVMFLASLGVVGASKVAPASAWLNGCSSSFNTNTIPVYGWASCTNYGAPGGQNQVRVWVRCGNAAGQTLDIYGPWKTGTYNTSYAYCPSNYDRIPVKGFQTR